jgi:hypothetical protein
LNRDSRTQDGLDALTVGGGRALRTEAWRTVLRAAAGEKAESLDPRDVHAANAGAFIAGTVQGQAALPARIALLRRFGGASAPDVSQIALADAPIVLFEVCAAAVLAAVGSTAVGMIPAWAPWAMLAGAVAALGSTSLVTAGAAGMVVSSATVLAVLVYAGAVWAWRRLPEPVPA